MLKDNVVHEVIKETGYESIGEVLNIYPTRIEDINGAVYTYVSDTGVLMTNEYYKEYFKLIEQ